MIEAVAVAAVLQPLAETVTLNVALPAEPAVYVIVFVP